MAIDIEHASIQQAGPVQPFCVGPDATVFQVLSELKERACGEALVCRHGALAGIFTERDAMRVLASGTDLQSSIKSVMTPHPVALSGDQTIAEAVSTMSTHGHRRLPLVDDHHRPTGVVHVAGIIQWLVQHFPTAVYNQAPVSQPMMKEREGP